jgi:hypothetical protein
MAGHRRSRADDDNRIRTVTRWLLAGSLAATGAVGGLAAAHTHASSSPSNGVRSESSSDDNSLPSPSASAPQQSFEAPVAQSGGS